MTIEEKPFQARFGEIGKPEYVPPTDFTQIPVVDLADLSNPSTEGRQQVVADVYNAATQVGFFYIKNHGIPEGLLRELSRASQQYFSLPHDDKMGQYMARKGKSMMGYTPPKPKLPEDAPEHLRVSGGDRVESFTMGYEPANDPAKQSGDSGPVDRYGLYGPNAWPDDETLPGFRDTYESYYRELMGFARRLLPVFALALGVEDDTFFDDLLEYPGTMCRLIHYLPFDPAHQDASSIGSHTDIGFFTILYQEVAGLQVRNAKGEWISAPPMPGTLVVNIGDAIHYCTNGIFKSTPHRAINLTGEERYSAAFFFYPDFNSKVSVMKHLTSKERPAIKEPFVFGEWIKGLMGETRS